MAQSPLLTVFAGFLDWAVPISELVIAGLLFFKSSRLLGLYASFFMMALFTGYIYLILNYSDFVPCSCGGILEKMSWHQHLAFNIGFAILAAIAIIFSNSALWKKTIFLLILLVIVAMASLTLLFLFSENKVHRNNSFIRRYPHAPAVFNKAVDLDHNSWYIAGIDQDKIYLGNSTAPLNIKVLDTTLRGLGNYRITLDQMDLPFSAVRVNISPPYFYVEMGWCQQYLEAELQIGKQLE